jgi:tetratricopeptide (TPR) repeat protein
MHRLILMCFAFLACAAFAQGTDMTSPGYTLALPNHPGRLHFEASSFPIVEASAKPSGSEFGLRGQDKDAAIDLLAFLFLFPEEAPLTSEKCRDAIMGHVKAESREFKLQSSALLPRQDLPVAVAQYSTKSPRGQWSVVRAFVANGDLCSDIEFSSLHAISVDSPQIKDALATLSFDPHAKPGFRELFYYATVLYDHQMMKAAAPVYEQAFHLLPANEPENKWRRVATDQAVMAYGISGDIKKARMLLNAAVQADPGYPLNYYNLACADAEEGNAANAKLHLQQAFDRKANVIPGENLPDLTRDDSLLKLKDDKAFWSFVEGLQKSR